MEVKLKKGDSLVWECEYTDDIGAPVDMSTYVVKCQAKDSSGSLLFDLSSDTSGIDIYDAATGKFRIAVYDTTEFSTGNYEVDIQYTMGVLVKSSETFKLTVVKDITS